jgi:hypothetical protein
MNRLDDAMGDELEKGLARAGVGVGARNFLRGHLTRHIVAYFNQHSNTALIAQLLLPDQDRAGACPCPFEIRA